MYLTQSLHRAVQQHPDRVAVRFGSRQRTYREFVDRVARLAGALQKLGMQVGDRVAMLSLNSDRYLEYQMAVPWGGGVLNPCNIRWSAAEILYSLDDSGSSILLVDEAFRPLVEQFRRDSSTLREVIYCGDGEAPAGMHGYEALLADAAPVPDAVRRGEDLAGIFYTGGTTGFPKGVMLSHTNLCSSALALHAEGLGLARRHLPARRPDVPSGRHGRSASAHWIEGNTHAVIPAFNPELVLDILERDRVTHVLLVPTMIQMLVDHPAMKKPHDLVRASDIALRCVADLGGRARPGAGGAARGQLHAGLRHDRAGAARDGQPGRAITRSRAAKPASCARLGVPALHRARIVDADGNEVPRGTVGEIAVRGPDVMQGYWNKPEQTAAARAATDGCIPAMARTWTTTASSSSSTASRT